MPVPCLSPFLFSRELLQQLHSLGYAMITIPAVIACMLSDAVFDRIHKFYALKNDSELVPKKTANDQIIQAFREIQLKKDAITMEIANLPLLPANERYNRLIELQNDYINCIKSESKLIGVEQPLPKFPMPDPLIYPMPLRPPADKK